MAVEVPLTRGLVAIVDESDAEHVLSLRWYALPGAYTYYAARGVRRSGGGWTTLLMHKVLTGWPRTDHANGDGLDNRRVNLRPATAAQNIGNRRKAGGSSRFKGVGWFQRQGRWRAYIELAGRQIFLGHFDDEEEAAQAYDAAARRHFGEYAALNFPEPGERAALAGQPQVRPSYTTAWRRRLRGSGPRPALSERSDR